MHFWGRISAEGNKYILLETFKMMETLSLKKKRTINIGLLNPKSWCLMCFVYNNMWMFLRGDMFLEAAVNTSEPSYDTNRFNKNLGGSKSLEYNFCRCYDCMIGILLGGCRAWARIINNWVKGSARGEMNPESRCFFTMGKLMGLGK